MRSSIIAIAAILFFSYGAFAIPRFALRTGGQCIDCHVNPTGGLIRNSDGWKMGKSNLQMWPAHDVDDFETSPVIGKNINFGFDLRTQYLAVFDSAGSKSDFHRMSGSVYINTAVSSKLNILARYDFVQQIYEAYAIARVFQFDGYIKAGTFTPNFGIRLDDHSAYSRMGDYHVITNSNFGLPFGPKYTETGVEAGYNYGESASLTFSAGGSGYPSFQQDPAYTASLSLFPKLSDDLNLMIGSSFASQKRNDISGLRLLNTKLAAVFGGLSFGAVSLLAEYDYAKDLYQADSSMTALMLELAYKITPGLESVLRYDGFSGDDPLSSDGKKLNLKHIVVGLSWYPYSFIELIPQFRFQLEDPEVKNNAAVLQFHFWY